MRQHHGVCLGVREVEGTAQHVTDLVVETGTRGREADGRQVGAVQHLVASGRVARTANHHREPLGQGPGALESDGQVDRVGSGCPQRVDAVRERVQPTRDAQVDGQAQGQVGVIDDRRRQDPVVDAGGLDGVFRQPPHVGRLGAGVRRGNGKDREPAGQGNCLGESDRGSPADAHEHVGLGVLRGRPRSFRVLHGHVLAYVGPAQHHRESLGHGVRSRTRTPAGDHEDPRHVQAFHLRAEVGPASPAPNRTRWARVS